MKKLGFLLLLCFLVSGVIIIPANADDKKEMMSDTSNDVAITAGVYGVDPGKALASKEVVEKVVPKAELTNESKLYYDSTGDSEQKK